MADSKAKLERIEGSINEAISEVKRCCDVKVCSTIGPLLCRYGRTGENIHYLGITYVAYYSWFSVAIYSNTCFLSNDI